MNLANISIEHLFLAVAALLLVSVAASKASERLGVPALLLFLAIGMLAGSDGPGGIYFDNAKVAQGIGVLALVLILFAGGFDTDWDQVRPVLWKGLGLSTLGVFLTAGSVGAFCHWVLSFSLLEGLLLGAIVSSTDAAAVLAVLRSRNVSLRSPLKPLLELESGSNDPMAVFLTVGLIQLALEPSRSLMMLLPMFFQQMLLGLLLGYLSARAMTLILKNLNLWYEGLYPVLSLAMVLGTYGLTSLMGGNGFLAVYVAGLLLGREQILHKKTLLRVHDAQAWLMQIVMFLVLGLLVFPSQVKSVAAPGFILALFLMFVARPFSVFVSLSFSQLSLREKTMIAWVGLRGAAPIILATFPLVAGVPDAARYFHLVFFIVVMSVLLQGPVIPVMARWLKVEEPLGQRRRSPLELESADEIGSELQEFIVPFNSAIAGKRLTQINLPADSLITLVGRDNQFFIPSGSTVLREGDVLSVLASPSNRQNVADVLMKQRP